MDHFMPKNEVYINLRLDKIVYSSNKIKLSGFFIFFLVVFFIGYMASTKILKNQWLTALQQQIELNQKLKTQDNKLKYFSKNNKKTNKLNLDHEQYKQQLSKPIDITRFINELAQTATTNFVNINSIKPLPVFRKKLLTIYPLEISISGHYQKLCLFINQLKNLSYLAIWQKIKITKSENNSLNMQALLEIHSSII
jgi:Tfp pilus assembly protein PilO